MTLSLKIIRKKGLIGLLFMAFVYSVLTSCAPKGGAGGDVMTEAEKATLDSLARVQDRQCRIWLSTAFEYFKNKDFESSLANYRKMANGGCTEKYGDKIWIYLGNSYRELGKPDSALWVFQEGLKEQPENIGLHENVAFLHQLAGKSDLVIRENEIIAELDPTNIARWRKLHDLYFRSAYYEKDLEVLNKIIDMDDQDVSARNDMVTVVKLLGGDVTELLKGRHLDNPDNTEYLLEYANSVYEVSDFETAVSLFEKLLVLDPNHFLALDRIANSYKNLDDTESAIKSVKRMLKLRANDKQLIYDIADLYKLDGQFKTAYSWANKTISAKPKDGRGYYVRALILEEISLSCQADKDAKVPSIHDKLVYELALDDVNQAAKLGYGPARSRAEFLVQMSPDKGDIFMHPEKFKPIGECYNWIKRSVKRK